MTRRGRWAAKEDPARTTPSKEQKKAQPTPQKSLFSSFFKGAQDKPTTHAPAQTPHPASVSEASAKKELTLSKKEKEHELQEQARLGQEKAQVQKKLEQEAAQRKKQQDLFFKKQYLEQTRQRKKEEAARMKKLLAQAKKAKKTLTKINRMPKKLKQQALNAFALEHAHLLDVEHATMKQVKKQYHRILETVQKEIKKEEQKLFTRQKKTGPALAPAQTPQATPGSHVQKKQANFLMEIFNKIMRIVRGVPQQRQKEIPLIPEKSSITTIYDSLYQELSVKKIVTVEAMSKKYNLNPQQVLVMAKNLEDTGHIEVMYPLLGSPRLVLKERGELADETN